MPSRAARRCSCPGRKINTQELDLEMFVSRLEGSYSGVMGLPVYETAELLEAFGIPLLGEDAP